MPEKYHINTKPVLPRLPRIGKCGVVDWREDCAGCHNCVKKLCVFDRYRQEANYIRGLKDVDTFFNECMGCFTCVQSCTKGLLALSSNPVYERLGNKYWTPEIIQTTWNQAETSKIPVSGGGYRGRFSGQGFDSMWTDMSEIVRPTRDGIHGREYISTAVDIGRKLPLLTFHGKTSSSVLPPLVHIPLPLIIDMPREQYRIPKLIPIMQAVATQTGIIMILDYNDFGLLGDDKETKMHNIVPYIAAGTPLPPREILHKANLVEIGDSDLVSSHVKELKDINSKLVIAVRVMLDSKGIDRAVELAREPYIEAVHLVADINGNQIGVENPLFIKDMVRRIHNSLVRHDTRDEVTIIAGGGIAMAEHMAKQIICGADVVSIDLPLLISLECRLCERCQPDTCPAKIEEMETDYGVGRMTNLLAAWHDQLIEVMGAMGIREIRRMRGEVGRAMFFEDLEEETFGKLFGTRKKA